jgi:hypothetical protein
VSAAEALGLPEALERAAGALAAHADAIRPANGDPATLLDNLGSDGGARVLEWLLSNLPVEGEELASAWCDEAGGDEALRRVRGDSLSKAGRKALRRIQHRLRSRGASLPSEAPAPVVAKLPPLEDRLEAALVSPVDPRGSRVAYLVEPNPQGGARMFEAMIDEERGVLSFEVYSAGRSRIRRFLREAGREGRFAGVEAPVESVRALLERIAASQPKDRPLPRSFAEWRSRVASPPEGALSPGELALRELGDEVTPERLRRVVELVRAGELGPWPPGGDALVRCAERVAEVGWRRRSTRRCRTCSTRTQRVVWRPVCARVPTCCGSAVARRTRAPASPRRAASRSRDPGTTPWRVRCSRSAWLRCSPRSRRRRRPTSRTRSW